MIVEVKDIVVEGTIGYRTEAGFSIPKTVIMVSLLSRGHKGAEANTINCLWLLPILQLTHWAIFLIFICVDRKNTQKSAPHLYLLLCYLVENYKMNVHK